MNLELVRYRLKEFIARHIRIDEWGLNFPDQIDNGNSPPSIAREEPVSDAIQIVDPNFDGMDNDGPVLCQVRLEFTIMFRFSAVYQYVQLPKASAETALLKLCRALIKAPECVDEEFHSIAASGRILIAEMENQDWLLTYRLSVTPVFEAEPDDLTPSSSLMLPHAAQVIVIPGELEGEFTPPFATNSPLAALRIGVILDGVLSYADNTNPAHASAQMGILRAAIATGDSASLFVEGPFTHSGWNWIPNQPIFLGQMGHLTQEAPQSGTAAFSVEVARALTPEQIYVKFQQVYRL